MLEPTSRNIVIWLCLYFLALIGVAAYCLRRLWRGVWPYRVDEADRRHDSALRCT